ncbi:MAG: hypothetical protein MHM6MM_003852 [Cercozoa sp. M6MM]
MLIMTRQTTYHWILSRREIRQRRLDRRAEQQNARRREELRMKQEAERDAWQRSHQRRRERERQRRSELEMTDGTSDRSYSDDDDARSVAVHVDEVDLGLSRDDDERHADAANLDANLDRRRSDSVLSHASQVERAIQAMVADPSTDMD